MSHFPTDQEIGRRVRDAREDAGIKQQGDLVPLLRAAGLPWSQGTLSRVELGQRSVKVTEAAVLAEVLGVTVPALIGAPESTTREVLWEAYLGAENVAKVLRTVEDVYWETVRGVRDKARQDDELRSRVQERRDKYLAIRSEDLRRQAMRDGDDVSTPEAWAAYTKFWGLDAIPAIRAATDVLEGLESADDAVGGEG